MTEKVAAPPRDECGDARVEGRDDGARGLELVASESHSSPPRVLPKGSADASSAAVWHVVLGLRR
jgi:hypothetical protein